MADIDIQRKKSVWPWIIGLIVLIVIVWALFEMGDEEETLVPQPAVVAPVESPPLPVTNEPLPAEGGGSAIDEPVTAAPMPPPPTEADNEAVPVATIVLGPADFLGQPVVGTAQVAEVVSDRGFWLEQDGQRMFAMIADTATMEDAIDLNPGQQVRLAGVIYDSAMAGQIAGGVDPATMALVADQPAFLLVDSTNIVLMEE